MKKTSIIYIMLFIFTNFDKNINKNEINIYQNIRSESNAFYLNLDFETSVTKGVITTVNLEATHLALLNGPTNSIKIFDMQTSETVNTIAVNREGPNAIEFPIYMLAHDNEFYVYDFYPNELCHVDENSNVIKRYKTLKSDDSNLGQIPNSLAPIIVSDKFIYVSTQGRILKNKSNYHNGHAVMKINKKTGEILPLLKYPDIYTKNFVGGGIPSMVSLTFNPNSKSVFASFPLDDRIYEITDNDNILIHESSIALEGMSNIPFQSESKIMNSSPEEIQKRHIENPSYSILHYDKYTNIYYRFVSLPIVGSEKVKKSLTSDLNFRNYKVYAFNENFELIGTSDTITDMDLSFGSAKYFSTKDGFFVANKNQVDENRMYFNKLSIENH